MNIRTDLPETMIGAGHLFGRTLAELGVRQVFTIVGSHIGPLLAGCEDAGIAVIDTRHEATAGHAAEGYAKACGQPGVCIVTAGPGFTNALTAMMGCFVDATPAIFVAGAAPLQNPGPNPLQGGFSQVDMARPVTKAAFVASHAGEIPELLRQAWRIASSGRPGPVFIEIATDVAHSDGSLGGEGIPAVPAADTAAAIDDDIDQVIDRLDKARRPLIVAGGGVKYAGAYAELSALAEATGLPVLTNFDSHGVLPLESPYWRGSLNLASRLPAAAQCDLLIFLGARFGLLTGGLPGRFTHPDLNIVQVDIDPSEFRHLRPGDLGIAADCRAFLGRLNARLAARDGNVKAADRSEWLTQFRADDAAIHAAWNRDANHPGLIHPYRLAHCIVKTLPRDTIYVVDGGDTKHWVEMNLAPEQPGRYISRAYSGALGCSQGLALGAHFAHKDAPICQIIGDGAWGFHLQEIDTYVRHNVPIITIVVNNGAWGSIRHIQQRLWKGRRYVATDLGFTRYDRVAAGFGCLVRRVDTTSVLTATLRDALNSDRPWLIDAIADPEPDPLAPPV